jgi:hypothetical protein
MASVTDAFSRAFAGPLDLFNGGLAQPIGALLNPFSRAWRSASGARCLPASVA